MTISLSLRLEGTVVSRVPCGPPRSQRTSLVLPRRQSLLPGFSRSTLQRESFKLQHTSRSVPVSMSGQETSTGTTACEGKKKPLYTFGIVSDVQWAPIPDGFSFHGTPRFYADALEKTKRAVQRFEEENVSMCVHLGDIVDAHAVNHQCSEEALNQVLDIFESLAPRPILHCIGNHCLYNAPRHVLNKSLGINDHKIVHPGEDGHPGEHSYFVCRPYKSSGSECGKYAFIVLDGYDVSILGYEAGHPHHELAKSILEEKNPNAEKNSNAGLQGLDKRFVAFGGGISEKQISWLEKELERCQNDGEKAIVFSHLCLHPGTCVPTCLLYNYHDVLEAFRKYPGVVQATFAGHAHADGYCFEDGIHHRVCEAVLETQPGEDCHGIVSIYNDFIDIKGFGNFSSATYDLL
jgi:manganese-dependent ADP-ribose/CDP-alcohol diphosphatase